RAARPFLAGRILHCVIAAAQLDRIEVELDGKLVHRALERVDIGHDWRRAHEAGRIAVRMHDRDAGLDRAEAIEARAVLHAGDRVVVRPRADLLAFVNEAGDLAVAPRPHADAMA